MLRAYLEVAVCLLKRHGECGVMHRCCVEEGAVLSSELVLSSHTPSSSKWPAQIGFIDTT